MAGLLSLRLPSVLCSSVKRDPLKSAAPVRGHSTDSVVFPKQDSGIFIGLQPFPGAPEVSPTLLVSLE